MKERPIIYSGPMVRATLNGSKTQTRRLRGLEKVNESPDDWRFERFDRWVEFSDGVSRAAFVNYGTGEALYLKCPYGQPGDLLWVRETWQVRDGGGYYTKADLKLHYTDHPQCGVLWEKDQPPTRAWWRSPIFMPRWASRINLRLTDVRVQRVQDIGEEDAAAEGVFSLDDEFTLQAARLAVHEGRDCVEAVDYFRHLWDSINAKRGHPWAQNDWVWALTFEVAG